MSENGMDCISVDCFRFLSASCCNTTPQRGWAREWPASTTSNRTPSLPKWTGPSRCRPHIPFQRCMPGKLAIDHTPGGQNRHKKKNPFVYWIHVQLPNSSVTFSCTVYNQFWMLHWWSTSTLFVWHLCCRYEPWSWYLATRVSWRLSYWGQKHFLAFIRAPNETRWCPCWNTSIFFFFLILPLAISGVLLCKLTSKTWPSTLLGHYFNNGLKFCIGMNSQQKNNSFL